MRLWRLCLAQPSSPASSFWHETVGSKRDAAPSAMEVSHGLSQQAALPAEAAFAPSCDGVEFARHQHRKSTRMTDPASEVACSVAGSPVDVSARRPNNG